MFIPLRTDRPPRRRPVVTESLIIINMVVYLIGLASDFFGWIDIERFVAMGWFHGQDFRLYTLITYQFLHDPGSIFHLLFNMVFLWIFGCAVEDRIGRLSFLGFYLIGGAVAALAHMQVSPAPVIGASGAVAGVTGAFLALFPRARIKMLVFFFIIGIFEIPAVWFIGFFFILDIVRQVTDILGAGGSRVAYMAHIAGYVYGFGLAFVLLALNIMRHDDYDVFYLFRQSRRRAAFRSASKGDARGLWEGHSKDTGERIEKKFKKAREEEPQPEDEALLNKRSEINRLIASHELSEAATKYQALLREHPELTFTEDRQLDLANQLNAEGAHEDAARAYELYLKAYPHAARSNEVRLMLGILYARQLGKPGRAKELITAAKAKLTDAKQSQLADQLLTEL